VVVVDDVGNARNEGTTFIRLSIASTSSCVDTKPSPDVSTPT